MYHLSLLCMLMSSNFVSMSLHMLSSIQVVLAKGLRDEVRSLPHPEFFNSLPCACSIGPGLSLACFPATGMVQTCFNLFSGVGLVTLSFQIIPEPGICSHL